MFAPMILVLIGKKANEKKIVEGNLLCLKVRRKTTLPVYVRVSLGVNTGFQLVRTDVALQIVLGSSKSIETLLRCVVVSKF